MESHYEEQSPAAKAGTHKPYIDFYRQGDNNTLKVQRETELYTTQRELYEEMNSVSGGTAAVGSNNLILRSDPLEQQKNYNQMRTDNFLDAHLKVSGHDKLKEDYKKMMQDNKAVALKRRSVENSEAFLNNRQNEGRQLNSGARSALNNYPTHQPSQSTGNSGMQQLKQINKNRIERDYIMENVFGSVNGQQQQQLFQNSNSISQQQQLQQQSKRSLAKSQSQNRLVLVSHDTIMNKGNPYSDAVEGNAPDKNSFSDQSLGRTGNPPQDLLYKQHHLYSSNNQTQQKAWHLKAQSSNNLLSHLSTTKECTFCNKTGGIHSDQCSAIYCIKDSLGMMIQNNLSKKYSTNRDYYNLKIVNDLIYNENTHIVSIFKDYLILDDINEFLKRSYTYSETKVRLPKLCSFYDKYSQVFPNYVILPESKYMFKNIQRKQKLIDEQYQIQEEIAKKAHQTLLDDDRLFNSNFYNSVYRMDLSMSRQQYEDQAKSIASIAGRPSKATRIDQMKIDELVDRFLMKDSESNIQLITTAGLDFSGFTHQSTFINDKISMTPNKQQLKNFGLNTNNGKQSIGQVQQKQAIQMLQPKNQPGNAVGQRKESVQNKKSTVQSNTNFANGAVRKQKGSFNNNHLQQKVGPSVPKLDTNKVTMTNLSGSTKTTPRLLNKNAPYTLLNNNEGEILKQQIQTSPATKEAISSYLHNCQIEGGITPQTNDQMLSIQVLDQLESPQMQSPQFTGQKLLAQSSQTALSQQIPTNSLSANNRQLMKSQCVIPTIQLGQKEITNLKKTTRLSGGNYNQAQKPTPQNKKSNISPVPLNQNLQSQNNHFTQSSRNNIVSNSTQKSLKSVNSHAKYLSGGNDQYQRLLQQNQNPYATHETIQNAAQQQQNNFGSSSKKIQGTLSKQDILMLSSDGGNTFQSRKHLQNHHDDNMMENDGLITGEDCDDAGIADERFASPDIFGTADIDACRKSIQSRQQLNTVAFSNGGATQPILLTSCEDNRILSQCNNYEQIKKHLEQFVTVNNQALQQENNSNAKKYVTTMSSEKMQYELDNQKGYNKNQLAASAANNDSNNSRNGTAQKQFESLKQKIRGVFDGASDANSSNTNGNNNKTPNKSSTHSKKSNHNGGNQPQQLVHHQQQPTILQQQQNHHRMSIESRGDNLMLIASQNAPHGSLSSTSAAGRTLSFAQFSNTQQQQQQLQQQNNYRSITNIQQRKNSNQKQETSIESKRMSQNRQSFKEMSSLQMQHNNSGNNGTSNNNEKIKRCATGKTLSINDINQHTFGNIQNSTTSGQGNNNYLQHISNTTTATTLCNPTFIQSSNSNKAYQTHHQQQNSINGVSAQQININSNNSQTTQQAANTVRVMTPSYSLASLSKLISPTTSTSPITMTVTLASQASRKQGAGNLSKKSNALSGSTNPQMQSHHQHNPSQTGLVTSSSHQNFLLADKSSKIIGAKQQQIQTQAKQSRTLTSNSVAPQSQQQQQFRQNQIQQKGIQTKLQQSNSQEILQITPRGMPQQMQQKPANQLENSQNMSCTISTENNSTAKAVESKNPKFMRTIEEYSISNQQQQQMQQQQQQQTSSQGQYNTMLSASMGHRKSGTGLLSGSISQAQLDLKQRQKISTVVNSNQASIKRSTASSSNGGLGGTMTLSASVSHFKSPSQQLQAKKQIQGRYI